MKVVINRLFIVVLCQEVQRNNQGLEFLKLRSKRERKSKGFLFYFVFLNSRFSELVVDLTVCEATHQPH